MSAYPWLARRVGAERLLIIGAVAFAVRAFALAVVTDPLLATLTMVIHGIGFGLMLVGGVTYVARNAPPSAAATAQGILSATVFSLALIVGPGVGSFTAAAWGVTAMFVLSCVIGLAAVPLLWIAAGRHAPSGDPAPVP